MHKRLLTLITVIGAPAATQAAETATYTYDALGRVVTSGVSGGPATGTSITMQYDAAGNRVRYAVSGSPNGSAPRRIVVLPLNGYTIVPLPE